METFFIEKMSQRDIDEVQSIDSSSPYHSPWSKKVWVEESQNPLSHCFVAKKRGQENPDKPIGFICFRILGEESELLNIGVHPKERLKGIGKKLMHFYIHYCKERGVKSFFLEVSVKNLPAFHLYQTFQYQIIGTRKKFYSGEVDALLMRRSA
jgi:ribosomal-protein-alanine N-acetyltransferase